MLQKAKIRKRDAKSFSRRMIKVWILGIALPLLFVGALVLWQVYRNNRRELEEGIGSSFRAVAADMEELMEQINSMSWLLEADGTVGEDLNLYFEEEDTIQKGDLLIYIQEQIANYEVANSSVANLTYLYLPGEGKTAVKINQSSLAVGAFPNEDKLLCRWQNLSFYGPHMTQSKVGPYLCLSSLRPYKLGQDYGDIYIYAESGYHSFERLIPEEIFGMQVLFLIQSENGSILYSSDEKEMPLETFEGSSFEKIREGQRRYLTFETVLEGGWKLHLWIPSREYYRRIYLSLIHI